MTLPGMGHRMAVRLLSFKLFICMMIITDSDFRGVDLNLLLVFRALYQERNVTRAARRLFLGQPAVSAALKRLRQMFGDPLFVRTPRGMVPTERALELWGEIEPLLSSLQEAMKRRPTFDHSRAQRVFHIGLSDALEVVLMPPLLQQLSSAAPGIRLVTHRADAQRAPAMLDAGEIELAVGVHRSCNAWHRIQPLFQWHFVCLYNPQLIRLRGKKVAMKEFLRYPHVLTSFNAGLRGFVDEQLEQLGLERQVMFSSPGFAVSPFIVQRTAAFTSVPKYIADVWCETLGLVASPLPFPVPDYDVSLLWHKAADTDSGLNWLMDTLKQTMPEAVQPAA